MTNCNISIVNETSTGKDYFSDLLRNSEVVAKELWDNEYDEVGDKL